VRVFPNLYPAFERHEVVVHTPRHVASLADLSAPETALVADAWQARARAYPPGYVHAFVNEGAAAGASREHTHSQLVWLGVAPPVPGSEQRLDELLSGEVVLEREGLLLLCPHASRGPYEMLVAPAEQEGSAFESALLSAALDLAAEGIRRLRDLEPAVPLNLWLHDVSWWHLELLPRLNVLAGLELGAGVFVNTLPPEEAATRLRGAAV